MTDLEKRAVLAMCSVKLPSHNWHARRTKQLCGDMVLDSQRRLSVADRTDLWFLVWRYRRQIADAEVVAHADELVNGALHLAL